MNQNREGKLKASEILDFVLDDYPRLFRENRELREKVAELERNQEKKK